MRNIRFTFPEMLAVTAVLALHAAFLAPALSSLREEARRSRCAGNLRHVGSALNFYEQEKDATPECDSSSGSFRQLLENNYLQNKNVLSCPSNSVAVDLDRGPGGISYYIDPRTPHHRHPMRAISADRNLYGDWTDNHGPDGVNVLFGGAAVQFVRDEEAGDAGVIANPHLEKDTDIYRAAFRGDPENAWITYSPVWDEYNIMTFRVGTTAWKVPENTEAIVVLVGGGGGGGGNDGRYNAGGGGGGGEVYVHHETLRLSAGEEVRMTAGAGGAGGRAGSNSARSGDSSSFEGGGVSLAALGGGAGACLADGAAPAQDGGSGGGGSGGAGSDGGSAIGAGHGHDGGSGRGNRSGGGGGAGKVGQGPPNNTGGQGGDGIHIAEEYDLPELKELGEDGYFAGGGAGAERARGGRGGGGDSGNTGADGEDGVDGTGGGGSGSRQYLNNQGNGGDGGDGIVILVLISR